MFLVLLSSSLFSAVPFRQESLLKYASYVARANDINIYVDVPLASKIVFYVPDLPRPSALLSAFKKSLSVKHLILLHSRHFDYYYIIKDKRYIKRLHFIHLRYHSFSRFKKFFKMSAIKFKYFAPINSVSFLADDFQYLKVAKFFNSLDVKSPQYYIRFVIFSFNNNVSSQKGFKFSSSYRASSGVVRSAVNSLVFPLSTSSPFLSNVNFFSALHLLSSANIVKVSQSPFFMSLASSKFSYSSFLSVPYLRSSVKTSSNIASSNNSYQYKKVGLFISGFASSSFKSVVLHLKIKIASLIDNNNNSLLPSSSVRLLNSVTRLTLGKVLIISGLKKRSILHHTLSIPFLSKIPYLGHLFTYRYQSSVLNNVSIAVSVSSVNR